MWTLIRFLHVIAMAFFVGGQLMLFAAVVPAERRHGTDAAMRAVARRFGAGSVLALAILVATGTAMAARTDRWGDSVLQVKLMVLVLVGVLVGLHIASPQRRVVAVAVFGSSVVVVWLGVKLSHG
jgi:uncharacterized membrane protein